MTNFLTTLWITLAQTTQPAATGKPTPKADAPSMWPLLIGVLLVFFVFTMLSGRGRKKQQKAHDKMLADMGRNDRVVTIGGLVGVIVDVKDDEVVVKIDESNNTKIRMKKWAIRAMDAKESADDQKK